MWRGRPGDYIAEEAGWKVSLSDKMMVFLGKVCDQRSHGARTRITPLWNSRPHAKRDTVRTERFLGPVGSAFSPSCEVSEPSADRRARPRSRRRRSDHAAQFLSDKKLGPVVASAPHPRCANSPFYVFGPVTSLPFLAPLPMHQPAKTVVVLGASYAGKSKPATCPAPALVRLTLPHTWHRSQSGSPARGKTSRGLASRRH